MKQKKSSTVYLNYPDYSIKTGIFPGSKKICPKENLTYYWYASNKIMETKGGYDGKILNGSYTSFFLSNNLKEKGSFKNGLKNGAWITWYENGKIKEIITWKKGLKSGCNKNNEKNGNLVSEAVYKNDKLNGCQTIYADGKITSKKKYSNGIEIVKVHTDSNGKDSISSKPANKVSAMYRKIVKGKDKADLNKKENKKKIELKQSPKRNVSVVKPKKTFKEKLQAFFKKKNTSEKTEKTQNKGK
jgi:hypothetical protein